MSHVRFASKPLGPTPSSSSTSRRRASTGESHFDEIEIGRFRSSLRGNRQYQQQQQQLQLQSHSHSHSHYRHQVGRSVDLTLGSGSRSFLSPNSSSSAAATPASFLNVPTVHVMSSSLVTRPTSEGLEVSSTGGVLALPHVSYRPQSTPPLSTSGSSPPSSCLYSPPTRRSRSPRPGQGQGQALLSMGGGGGGGEAMLDLGTGTSAPRAAQLAPPKFSTTPHPSLSHPNSSPSSNILNTTTPNITATSLIGSRPTVAQAKAMLFESLSSYECPVEDKIRVLRNLTLEIENDLIEGLRQPYNHHVNTMINTGTATGTGLNVNVNETGLDLGEAFRAVRDAHRAKTSALSQLQKAVHESRLSLPVVRR